MFLPSQSMRARLHCEGAAAHQTGSPSMSKMKAGWPPPPPPPTPPKPPAPSPALVMMNPFFVAPSVFVGCEMLGMLFEVAPVTSEYVSLVHGCPPDTAFTWKEYSVSPFMPSSR